MTGLNQMSAKGQKSGHARIVLHKGEGRFATALFDLFKQFCQAVALRFLRHPSRPNAPRPVAKSGSAVGSGTVLTGVNEKKRGSAIATDT